MIEAPPAPGAGHVSPESIPPILTKIPGINPAHLTEADLLLADPATHTHPLGSHSLLAIHPGFENLLTCVFHNYPKLQVFV